MSNCSNTEELTDDIDSQSDDYAFELDENEVEENIDALVAPKRSLMPELALEQEISSKNIQSAMEKFAGNFAEIYPSSGPTLFMGPLDEAINNSLLQLNEPCPLLLYLHRNGTVTTHLFCKNVLCNDEIIKLLNNYYIVWPWDCTLDANYQRLLWMLLEQVSVNAAALVAEIPLDDYPQLICLLHEGSRINAIKVIHDVNNSTSIDEIFLRLTELRDYFDTAIEEFGNEVERSFVFSSKNWLPPPSELQNVERETEEFGNIARYFSDGHFQIICIERIKNKNWQNTYNREKEKAFPNHLYSNVIDRIVFHGCLSESSETILRHGFNENIVGIHGTKYGEGFYFSKTPMRSNIYALPNLSNYGERTMLVCRTYIEYTNSVANDNEIYVIDSNQQILPEYRVTYKYICD